MKRLLVIILTIALTCTFCFGTCLAYAAEENGEPEQVQQADTEKVEKKVEKVTVAKVKGVKAKAISSSSIKVSWKSVKGATGYKVYRWNKKSGKYVLIKKTKKTSYTAKGLKSQTKRIYKVKAYKVKNGKTYVGKFSEKASATTKKSGVDKVMSVAKKKVGCSYSSGSCGPNSFDCSGFVYYVYKKSGAGKIKFQRDSAQGEYSQVKKYKVGSSISKAKKGDIVFFSASGKTSGINHVGIYAGNGKVVHAGSYRSGVCYGSTKALSRCGRKVCAVVRLAKN